MRSSPPCWTRPTTRVAPTRGYVTSPAAFIESADALGMTPVQGLRLLELLPACPLILAVVKTSAVINIGTVTLGAIGAGEYGQPILTGIRLNDIGLILEGAIPVAGQALLAQGLFELAERVLVPKGLRL